MQCIITSLTKTQTFPRLTTVTIPIKTGVTQIKKGHAEYIVEVTQGDVLCIGTTGKKTVTPITSGVCHVLDDTIIILT